MRLAVAHVVVALLALIVPPSSVDAQSGTISPVAPVDSPSARIVGVLHSGDLLRISVYRDSELSGEYLIDSRGTLQIPGIGVLQAAGLDPLQVKARLVDALRSRGYAQPEIAVQSLVRVSVLGEVRIPQLYKVDPGTSLIQLLTMAGGPTERAYLRRTRVVREGRSFTVDLESALAGSASGQVVLNSNDVVFVPRKSGFSREAFSFFLTTTTAVLSLITLVAATRKR